MSSKVFQLDKITDTARFMSPEEKKRVFGSTFIENQEKHSAGTGSAAYHPLKINVYNKLKQYNAENTLTDRMWSHYTGQNDDTTHPSEEPINSYDYWNSVTAYVAEDIDDGSEKDAFLDLNITASTPEEAAAICASVEAVLKKKGADQKSVVLTKSKEAGIRRGAITKQAKEDSPNTACLEAKEYKSVIDVMVDRNEQVMADAEALKSEKAKENKILQALDAAQNLRKTAEAITQRRAENKRRLQEIHELATQAGADPDALIDSVNAITQIKKATHRKINETWNAHTEITEETFKPFIEADLEAMVSLYDIGVLNEKDFLDEVVHCSDIIERSSFKNDEKTLFRGAFDEVSETFDEIILTAYAPDMSVAEFGVDDAIALYNKRAAVYRHIDTVTKDFADNPYLQNLDEEQNRHFINEMAYATIFPNYQIEMRMGIGGSTVGEPLGRLPAYVVPSVQVLQAVHDANMKQKDFSIHTTMPKLKVFSAERISSHINHFDTTDAERTAAASLTFMENCTEMIYGRQISDHIEFKSLSAAEIKGDKTIAVCQKVGARLSALYLKKSTPEEANKLTHLMAQAGISSEEFGSAVEAMGKRAYKHDQAKETGTEDWQFDQLGFANQQTYIERGMQYAAYHPIACLFGDVGFQDVKKDAHKVIKIGGQGEHYFNVLQRAIAVVVSSENENIIAYNNPKKSPLFLTGTTGCNPAPYYEGPGDLRVSDIHDEENFNQKVEFLLQQDKEKSTLGDWYVLQQELVRKERISAGAALAETIAMIGSVAPVAEKRNSAGLRVVSKIA